MINIENHFDWIARRLEFHEGCRLMPYRCPAGKLTIGIGRCIDTNPFTKEELQAVGDWKHGITKNAALMLLRNDIDRCKMSCRGWIFMPSLIWSENTLCLICAFNLVLRGCAGSRKCSKRYVGASGTRRRQSV